MRQIEEKEIRDYLLTGENRNIEYKPGFLWAEESSKKLKEEAIKTIIALSNTPKGGVLILGINHIQKSDGVKYEYPGVCPKNFNWLERNEERIQRDVHSYCSAPAEFEITYGLVKDNKETMPRKFILFNVNEFLTLPLITIKNSSTKEDSGSKKYVIEENEIYARSFKAIWSSRKCSYKELEDIVKMAADKYRTNLKLRGYVKLGSLEVKLREERADYE